MLALLRSNLRNLTRETVARPRFDLFTWLPSGGWPAFHGYCPDGLACFSPLTDLRRRWIQGNRIDNPDATRLMALIRGIRQLEAEGIPGDFVEPGVWKGTSAAILVHFTSRSGRRLFLCDTFQGFHRRDLADVDQDHTREIDAVLLDRQYALARIDCDLYQS